MLPGTAKYVFGIRNYKEEMKHAALGVLTLLMIHFLKCVSDCIWTGFAQAVCAMAACEAILRVFSTRWSTEEARKFVCLSYILNILA